MFSFLDRSGHGHDYYVMCRDAARVEMQGWWAPGANNTGGCGQEQTFELPFGYRGYN
jgi:hypothetical protein